MFTALTRPRTSSGVHSWIRVSRTYTLIMSQAPASAKASTESQIRVEAPNTVVKMPKPATKMNMMSPA